MSGVVIIVGILEWSIEWSWVFDPIAGLLTAAILGYEGVRTIRESLREEAEGDKGVAVGRVEKGGVK